MRPDGRAGLGVAWCVAATLALAGCDRAPAPEPAPTPAPAPVPPSSIAQDMAKAAGSPTRPPRPDVDWSQLTRDGWLVPPRSFQREVDAAKACLRASLLEKPRCVELQRMADRGVTDADVRATLAATIEAAPALAGVWQERFAAAGRTFAVPRIGYYGWSGDGFPEVAPSRPGCGEVLDNAIYCVAANAIHYDIVFLSRLVRAVRAVDGTPGTFAAIAVVGHELGHAVDVQLDITKLEKYKREVIADCFSGAAVGAVLRAAAGPSQARQVLETATPMTEGQLAMYLMGGPAMMDGDHPEGPVRASLFTRGFNLGAGQCTVAAIERR
ncbi:MAG: neutral zinc metallopeptidase [Vicinamibacterales bacterium]